MPRSLQVECGPFAGRVVMTTCQYRNSRESLVVLRCVGANQYFQEKVIFPFESWCFDCPTDSRIDVWAHGISGVELLETLPADALRAHEP